MPRCRRLASSFEDYRAIWITPAGADGWPQDKDAAAAALDGVELPAVRGRRDRVADPREAAALLRALEPRDRVIWATAMYAGLRLGELQALHGEDIDLKRGVIDVRRGWDQYEGEQTPKSRAGERRVPIVAALRPELDRALQARDHGLVFGRSATLPFSPSTLDTRAARAWKAAGLAPIGLHECRHTFASLMIAAGVNAKALQTFMGHASITITLDRYGHLFPGAESEAAALFDAYLTRAVGQSVGQSWGANGPSEALPGGAQLTLPGSSAPR